MFSSPILQELLKIARSWRIIHYLIDRQLRVAHRDKLLGNLWTLLDPLMMMLVLYLVFSQVRHISSVFCLYLFSGLLAWDIFSKSLTGCTLCLKSNKSFVHKFPVPLSIFPVAVVVHKNHDALWGLFAYLMIFLGIRMGTDHTLTIPWQVVFLPVWFGLFLLMTLGLCYMVAGLGVLFRDMADIVAIFLRMGFFLNPIFLRVGHDIPEKYQLAYFIFNPIAGFIVYLRVLLPGGEKVLEGYTIPIHHYPTYLAFMSILIFIVGLWVFMKGQRHYTKYI